MTDNQKANAGAQAEQKEADLVDGVVRVIDQQGVVVEEDGLRLLERDTVALPIQSVLGLVPLESEFAHTYSVTTS